MITKKLVITLAILAVVIGGIAYRLHQVRNHLRPDLWELCNTHGAGAELYSRLLNNDELLEPALDAAFRHTATARSVFEECQWERDDQGQPYPTAWWASNGAVVFYGTDLKDGVLVRYVCYRGPCVDPVDAEPWLRSYRPAVANSMVLYFHNPCRGSLWRHIKACFWAKLQEYTLW